MWAVWLVVVVVLCFVVFVLWGWVLQWRAKAESLSRQLASEKAEIDRKQTQLRDVYQRNDVLSREKRAVESTLDELQIAADRTWDTFVRFQQEVRAADRNVWHRAADAAGMLSSPAEESDDEDDDEE